MIYIMVFILGLITGSFLNVCIYRIPRSESIVLPPSHCTSCGSRLAALELVPVLSYLLLRGRCRHCSVKFSFRYTLVELLTAMVFTLLFSRYGLTVDFAAFLFLMSILIIVFFIDLDHQIIPNGLVLTGLIGAAAASVYNAFCPMVIYQDSLWWSPLLGVLPGTGFLFLVAIAGTLIYKTDDAMGMGDIKLFAPIGIFLGWKMCLLALLLSILSGGMISLFLMVSGTKKRKDTIPFGPFIVAGTFITIMWGQQIVEWYFSRIT